MILSNSNQHLWYQKLQQSIQQQIKKLYCQIRIPEKESLSMFPEHISIFPPKYPGMPICYHPSCGLCCNCSDSSMLQQFYRRVILIPKLQRSEYLSMLSHAYVFSFFCFWKLICFRSVMLDPFPFGMGVTALESFSLGLPIVTLPYFQVLLLFPCPSSNFWWSSSRPQLWS